MKVTFTVVFVDYKMTTLMQAADMFEKFKVIIRPPVPMEGVWEGDPKDFFNEDHLKKIVDNIHAELSKLPEGQPLNPKDWIAFIYSKQSDNYYFNPTINAISNGVGWNTAVGVIKSLGLQPIESKHPLYYNTHEKKEQESIHAR
jgi:hypothetical protein